MHLTAVERARSQLSGDNIMVCIRDDNYLNYSYPTELWITWLVLLTLVNQTPVFIHISTNAIRSMQFCWITTTYIQQPSWATFPHFLTEPASLANHAINTVCCFNTQATPPLYHVDLIVSLDIHPWRVKGMQVAASLPSVCSSSLNSPFLPSCLLRFLLSQGSRRRTLLHVLSLLDCLLSSLCTVLLFPLFTKAARLTTASPCAA